MNVQCRPDRLEQLRRDLEETIASINRLAPVARLPDEILSEIFSILAGTQISPWQLLQHHVLMKRRPRRPKLGWILVTHVCRDWRRVALGSPTLWRRVTFSLGRQWAKCMLTRARQIPLSITARASPPSFAPEVAYRIVPRLAQIRTLDFAATKSALSQFMALLTEPAPVLERLSLASEHGFYVGDANEIAYLPSAICQSQLPALHHLSLRNIAIQWTSPLLSNLRTLSIVLPIFESGPGDAEGDAGIIEVPQWPQPSTADIVMALENMPDLESLTISGTLPFESRDRIFRQDLRKVTMPHLSNLNVKGSIQGACLLLDSLVLLLDVDMRLTTFANEHTGLDTDVLIHALLHKVAGHLTSSTHPIPIPLTNLHITCDVRDCCPRYIFRGRVQPKMSRSTALEFEFVETGHYEGLGPFDEIISEIEPAVLQSLEISRAWSCDVRAPTWNRFMGQCDHTGTRRDHDVPIQYVRIDGTSFCEFCLFLDSSVEESREPVPTLPQLQTIVVYRINARILETLGTKLLSVLQRRKDTTVPLHRLVFDRPRGTLSEKVLDKIRAVVPEVVVQGPTDGWTYNY